MSIYSTPVQGNASFVAVSDTIVSGSKIAHALSKIEANYVNTISGTAVVSAAGNYNLVDSVGTPLVLPIGSVVTSVVFSSDVSISPTTVTAAVYLGTAFPTSSTPTPPAVNPGSFITSAAGLAASSFNGGVVVATTNAGLTGTTEASGIYLGVLTVGAATIGKFRATVTFVPTLQQFVTTPP